MEEIINKLLEEKFLTYKELSMIKIRESGESMASLSGYPGLRTQCIDRRMKVFTGEEIYVRREVAESILSAQSILEKLSPNCVLEVVYGYRHTSVQQESYEGVMTNLGFARADTDDIKEIIHRFVAVPEVAGHPTGGAVDLRIAKTDGSLLDVGTEAHDFIEKSYALALSVDSKTWRNRQLLRACMMAAGFAPYDGEWWHYSYGDREWAAYYNRPFAIYDQIDFRVPDLNLYTHGPSLETG
ncbi:MAG TPA: M15 family metallopeptidase [Alphaproteobacteria bacterium]|nr:M15 family metallopeptidase [Alphaproteobacteria bacterium]